MFLFLKRKELLSALFPVSLCHFLALSLRAQTIRQIQMSHIHFFLLVTLFCPSPPATWPAKVPIPHFSQIHISLTHTLQQDGTFANFGVHRGRLFVFLKSSAAKSAHMRSHGGDEERQLSPPQGGCRAAFCRRSLFGATIQRCFYH